MLKIDVANSVINSFAQGARIERRQNGIYVCWPNRRGEVSRRWQVRGGQDFYPTWSRHWIGGGTSCTALSQLVRWCQGRPVLPISSWRYWATPTVNLCSREAVDLLLAGGYPEHVNCVLCEQQIEGGLDWWSLKGVSGPCCGMRSGCRQARVPIGASA